MIIKRILRGSTVVTTWCSKTGELKEDRSGVSLRLSPSKSKRSAGPLVFRNLIYIQ